MEHISVAVRDKNITYFIAGNTSCSHENMGNKKTDGVTFEPAVALKTLQNIKTFATKEPSIILPCHDPFCISRLAEKQIYS